MGVVVRWGIVGLLMVGMVCSLIDRQVITLLVEPIKAEYGLSDTQFSLLIGPAFVSFYLLFGFPFGWAADNFPRKLVIALGIAIWSFATLACGLAPTFLMLLGARMLVGAGEASLTPSALSMMSDMFPRDRLPFVIGVFSVSMHLGGAGALLVGGALLSVFGDAPTVGFPVLGALSPWQAIFVIIALPGFAIAAAFLLSAEPKRRRFIDTDDSTEASSDTKASGFFSGVAPFYRANADTINRQLIAATLLTIGTYAFASWAPAYLIRVHDLPSDEVALLLGIVVLTCGPTGSVVGGLLASYLQTKRQRVDGPWIVMAISGAGTALFSPLVFLSNSLAIVAVFGGIAIFLGSLYLGIVHAAMQVICPADLRGRMSAIMLFVMNGLGVTLGPVLVALITDRVFGDANNVGASIATISTLVGTAAAILLFTGLSSYRESYARLSAS